MTKQMVSKLKRWGVVMSLIVAFLTALTLFDVDLGQYRPVIAGEFHEHTNEFHEDKLERLKKEHYIAKTQEDTYKEKNKPVPDWLIDRIIYLEKEIKKIEDKNG